MQKFTEAKTLAEAKQNIGSDWAKIVKVDGGYIGFETITDYKIWKNQK